MVPSQEVQAQTLHNFKVKCLTKGYLVTNISLNMEVILSTLLMDFSAYSITNTFGLKISKVWYTVGYYATVYEPGHVSNAICPNMPAA